MAVAIVVGLIFAAPHSGYAAPLARDYEITVQCPTPFVGAPYASQCVNVAPGTVVGTLTGAFTGDDDDELIDISELTLLTFKWTPMTVGMTSFPPAGFERELSDFVFPMSMSSFLYATPTNNDPLMIPNTIMELSLIDPNDDGAACLDSLSMLAPCIVGQDLEVLGVGESDGRYRIAMVDIGPAGPVVIPEPSTWLLLVTGLVGVIGYAFSRRVRSAAPRRTPGASA
jgi:hypothetical protein